ncbi:MAG: hypothetical protein ABID61_05445 [Candidatus Micrarchaeota archaeon]
MKCKAKSVSLWWRRAVVATTLAATLLVGGINKNVYAENKYKRIDDMGETASKTKSSPKQKLDAQLNFLETWLKRINSGALTGRTLEQELQRLSKTDAVTYKSLWDTLEIVQLITTNLPVYGKTAYVQSMYQALARAYADYNGADVRYAKELNVPAKLLQDIGAFEISQKFTPHSQNLVVLMSAMEVVNAATRTRSQRLNVGRYPLGVPIRKVEFKGEVPVPISSSGDFMQSPTYSSFGSKQIGGSEKLDPFSLYEFKTNSELDAALGGHANAQKYIAFLKEFGSYLTSKDGNWDKIDKNSDVAKKYAHQLAAILNNASPALKQYYADALKKLANGDITGLKDIRDQQDQTGLGAETKKALQSVVNVIVDRSIVNVFSGSLAGEIRLQELGESKKHSLSFGLRGLYMYGMWLGLLERTVTDLTTQIPKVTLEPVSGDVHLGTARPSFAWTYDRKKPGLLGQVRTELAMELGVAHYATDIQLDPTDKTAGTYPWASDEFVFIQSLSVYFPQSQLEMNLIPRPVGITVEHAGIKSAGNWVVGAGFAGGKGDFRYDVNLGLLFAAQQIAADKEQFLFGGKGAVSLKYMTRFATFIENRLNIGGRVLVGCEAREALRNSRDADGNIETKPIVQFNVTGSLLGQVYNHRGTSTSIELSGGYQQLFGPDVVLTDQLLGPRFNGSASILFRY